VYTTSADTATPMQLYHEHSASILSNHAHSVPGRALAGLPVQAWMVLGSLMGMTP
jgi:hypothetical protein